MSPPRGLWRRLAHWLRRLVPRVRPLCDTCRYDYGNVCKRPERPNALQCPDYRRK
ncbi:MAG TPA: hypothetical protein VF530_06620 [Planctomycetota bacterium]